MFKKEQTGRTDSLKWLNENLVEWLALEPKKNIKSNQVPLAFRKEQGITLLKLKPLFYQAIYINIEALLICIKGHSFDQISSAGVVLCFGVVVFLHTDLSTRTALFTSVR